MGHLIIFKAVQVIRSNWVKEDVFGIPLGHPVGLMSLLMIHAAYMPVYKSFIFLATVDGSTGDSHCRPKK